MRLGLAKTMSLPPMKSHVHVLERPRTPEDDLAEIRQRAEARAATWRKLDDLSTLKPKWHVAWEWVKSVLDRSVRTQ